MHSRKYLSSFSRWLSRLVGFTLTVKLTKGVLVERLLSELEKNIPVGNVKNPKPKNSDKNKSGGEMKWFPDTAYWRVLKPKYETVDDPNNATFKNSRAPTITEEDTKYVPKKHDFDTHIER